MHFYNKLLDKKNIFLKSRNKTHISRKKKNVSGLVIARDCDTIYFNTDYLSQSLLKLCLLLLLLFFN